jgi:hypothetical protein
VLKNEWIDGFGIGLDAGDLVSLDKFPSICSLFIRPFGKKVLERALIEIKSHTLSYFVT